MVIKKSKSFTLIEVLVFTTILSLFFVVAAAVVIISLHNMKISEHKILATRYAQEALEWLRSQKEVDWNQFILRDNPSGLGTTYCINTLNWNTVSSCTTYGLGTPAIFKREVKLTNQSGTPVTQIKIEIVVSWQEVGESYRVPINSLFSVWE